MPMQDPPIPAPKPKVGGVEGVVCGVLSPVASNISCHAQLQYPTLMNCTTTPSTPHCLYINTRVVSTVLVYVLLYCSNVVVVLCVSVRCVCMLGVVQPPSAAHPGECVRDLRKGLTRG